MGWTYNNTANNPAPLPKYPNVPNSNFNSFAVQPANSFNPVNYAKPNSFGTLQNDLNDPMGNQTQLAQMIMMIVQQILQSFLQGGLLGNLGGGKGQGGDSGGKFGSANNSGFGGYDQYPASLSGNGYEGGMSKFRRFANEANASPIETKGWWNDCNRDCNFGETFRRAKREPKHREIECEATPKRETPPENKTPPKHNEPPKHNPPPKNNQPPDCPPPPKHNPPPEKPGKPVHGSVTGDPHFVGADGEKYDIKGKPGKTYNLIADKDMSVNARFAAYGNKGNTVMEALGFNFGKDKLSLDVRDGKSLLRYNGADVDTSKNWNHDGYSWDAKKQQLNVKKKVEKEEWDLTANVKGKGKDAYLDLYINKGSKVDKNDTKTTGLWGDSISGKKEAVNKDGGAGVINGANGKPLDKKLDSNSNEHKKALEAKEVKDLGSKKP